MIPSTEMALILNEKKMRKGPLCVPCLRDNGILKTCIRIMLTYLAAGLCLYTPDRKQVTPTPLKDQTPYPGLIIMDFAKAFHIEDWSISCSDMYAMLSSG